MTSTEREIPIKDLLFGETYLAWIAHRPNNPIHPVIVMGARLGFDGRCPAMVTGHGYNPHTMRLDLTRLAFIRVVAVVTWPQAHLDFASASNPDERLPAKADMGETA